MKIKWGYLWGVLILLYTLNIYISFISYDANFNFGYTEDHLYWHNLLSFLEGKVLYKNIFWEYNLLPLLIRLPFFVLFQKSFFAIIVINVVIIPIIGIILSYYIGKQLLGKKALLLFGTLLLFLGTNNYLSSIRYLVPGLGLIMTIVGMEKNDKRKTLVGSIILSLSLLSSIEYAIAAQIGLLTYFIATLIIRKKINKQFWLQLVLLEGVVGFSYLLYLVFNNAFQNFIRFHLAYIDFFYAQSPCREQFPRLSLFPFFFNRPIDFLSRWNYYIVPLFVIFNGFVLIYKKNIKYRMVLIVLTVYSLLVSSRIITTPCYYNYALTFPFLVLSYFMFHVHFSSRVKIVLIAIIIWFTISSLQSNPIYKLFNTPFGMLNKEEKEYLPKANIYLDKNLTKQYKDISKYIQTHTNSDDYIYSHRVGPYNMLSERKSPVSIASSNFYEIDPALVEQTLDELQKHPPKYIVINTKNGGSYSNSVRNIVYNIHLSGDKIVFEGDITPIEDYISQNYKVERIFNIALVAKRRDKPIALMKYFVPYNSSIKLETIVQNLEPVLIPVESKYEYKIKGDLPVLFFGSPEISKADLIILPMEVDLGIIKPYSKFVVGYQFITNQNHTITLNKVTQISSKWDNLWIYTPGKEYLQPGEEIIGVKLQTSKNYGFLPFGNASTIKFNNPQLYIKNPELSLSK